MPSGLKVIVEDVHTKDQVLARTYASTGDLAQLQGAVTNDLAALVGVSASQASHANPQAYRDFLLASALLREAPTVPRLEQARAQLGAITDAHPRFARAFSRLCGVELRMFRETSDPASFSAAERHCHRAMTLDETDWEVMLSLTDLYRTSGQLDKAIELAQRAEKSQPLSSAVARMLGVVYTQAGHDQAALNALQKALAVEPAYWRNYNAIGEYYFRRGAYADAAHYYALEIDHVRDKAMSLNNLAGALYLQGESTAAVAAWEESISEAPTINALMNLGSVAFFEEEFDSSTRMLLF